MKRIIVATLLSTSLVGVFAQTYTDQARVRSAQPLTENINVPRQECSRIWDDARPARVSYEQPRQAQSHQIGGAILGGIAGGVIGHQFGRGNGRTAATALGVMIGAVTGDKLANPGGSTSLDERPQELARRPEMRCHTVYEQQSRVTGYQVSYEYRGQTFTTTTRQHPGEFLRVRVSVDPIEY